MSTKAKTKVKVKAKAKTKAKVKTKAKATGKSARKNLIGTDPLAWLDEENQEQEQLASESTESQPEQESSELVNCIELDENLNIRDLDELHKRLSKGLERGKEVQIDASKVKKADAVTLQMLSSFYQSGPAENVDVKWTGISDEFRDVCQLSGLDKTLGINLAA